MFFDEILKTLTENLQTRLSHTFTAGKGLKATRITSEEAARLTAEAQSAKDAVDSTVLGYQQMSEITKAETQMFVAGMKHLANETEAYVDRVEAVVETAEVTAKSAQRTAIALQRYEESKDRWRETTIDLAGEFAQVMEPGGKRAIESGQSEQKLFRPR
jgi:hypothetical protein